MKTGFYLQIALIPSKFSDTLRFSIEQEHLMKKHGHINIISIACLIFSASLLTFKLTQSIPTSFAMLEAIAPTLGLFTNALWEVLEQFSEH